MKGRLRNESGAIIIALLFAFFISGVSAQETDHQGSPGVGPGKETQSTVTGQKAEQGSSATEGSPPSSSPGSSGNPPPSPARPRGGGISDEFPVFYDRILPGIDEEEVHRPAVSEEEPVSEGDENSDEDKSFMDSIRELFGSDKTIVNILILIALIVATLIYRTRSGKSRRRY